MNYLVLILFGRLTFVTRPGLASLYRLMRLLPFLFLCSLGGARAQQTPASASPSPTSTAAPARLVRLHFVPPPLEGTISLGIYDSSGKLVRVLQREANFAEFTAGHDALETTWDGNDDNGQPLPPGRYRARGYLVGKLQIEGIDNFFNDWVTEDNSPHIAQIMGIAAQGPLLQLTATGADGKTLRLLFDPASGKLSPAESPSPSPTVLPNDTTPPNESAVVAVAPGKGGTRWAIRRAANSSSSLEVVQLSAADKATLRRLTIAPNDPQPIAIAAAPDAERIFLLEKSPALERLRSLTLRSTTTAPNAEAVSDWAVDFEKKIVAHQDFALLNGRPVAAPNERSVAPEMVVQKLKPNPLEQNRPGQVELRVGHDADGSFLEIADGLPLRTVSDNGQVRRALLAPHGETALDLFQDDGAVVEQFRVSGVDQMMRFDCGEFDLK